MPPTSGKAPDTAAALRAGLALRHVTPCRLLYGNRLIIIGIRGTSFKPWGTCLLQSTEGECSHNPESFGDPELPIEKLVLLAERVRKDFVPGH